MLIRGTSSNDRLNGTNSNDRIEGLGGNDTLLGRGGNDRILGGSGADRIFGGSGNDRIFGGSGNDRIFGGSGNDSLKGGSGRDTIRGGSGNDTLDGGSDEDTLIGTNSRDRGRGEVDRIRGSKGDSGADVIVLGDSQGAYYLGNGNSDYALIDRFDFRGSNRDTIQLAGSSLNYNFDRRGSDTRIFFNNDLIAIVRNANVFDVQNQVQYLGGTVFPPPVGGNVIRGTNGNDFLIGLSGNELILGLGGNDTLNGSVGNDTLIGANQSTRGANEIDLIIGGAGSSGSDVIVLGDAVNGAYYVANGNRDYALIQNVDVNGNNTDIFQLAGSANDYNFVQAGIDTRISLNSNGDLVAIVQGVDSFTVSNAAQYVGGFIIPGGPVIPPNPGGNVIRGTNGNDFLTGFSGNERLEGLGGNDTLDGSIGADVLIGANPTTRGFGERDVLIGSQGSSGADVLVLGDSQNGAYYVGGGNRDFALIQNFDTGGTNRDTIQLAGSSFNYSIQASGTNTNIFLNNFGTLDLVATVQNASTFDVQNQIQYV